jgi:S1-C subfamily serine protease
MKKALSYIATFVLGVAVAVTSMLLIHDSKAEPTPIPEPTPIVIEKEVIKEIPVEVVKEVVKEIEVVKPTDLEKVVKDCKNSCVMIYFYNKDGTISQGSGWVYNGYIVTAKHGLKDYKRIEIFTDDTSNPRTANVHYVDDKLDLAILKASFILPSLKLGDSDKLIEGERIVAITSPNGTQNMIDECLYSGNGWYDKQLYMTISEHSMQGGSSGGAVFNYDSEVIGMMVKENLAIPIKLIKPILEEKLK